MRRLLPLALLVTLLPVVAAEAAPAAFVRRAGNDRYATAAEVSAAEVAPGVEVAYIATGRDFADALAAAPVAGDEGAPVLLVPGNEIPSNVGNELQRIQPRRIVVLGGPASVSTGVERDLGAYTAGDVDRIAGINRYDTAARLSAATYAPGVAEVYVVSGASYADAVSAGAAAVGRGPVLLVTRDDIPAATAAELDRLDPRSIVVVGGEAVVGSDVADDLDAYTPGAVARRAGADRYATSAAVSQARRTSAVDDVYLASGTSFADALAGAWAAGAAGTSVLLAQRTCVPNAVAAEIDRLQADRGVLLGGTAALTDDVGRMARCGSGVEVIATGLQVPWDVAFVDGGRAFITERPTGRILLREANGDIREVHRLDVNGTGEGGLLGLAASPNYGTDRQLYAYFTSETDNRVVRLVPGGAVTDVITGIPRAGNHDGGRIAFGPDGMLWITTGDAADGSRSQDRSSLAGKVLRLHPDGRVPADNPFASPVWALGFRNVQGITWDAAGRTYVSDIGPDRDDEVNIVVKGGNYGWPVVTGDANDARFVDPIVVRQPAVASWSGAAIVRGGVSEWDGDLLVAALRGRRLYRFDLALDGTVIGNGEELFTGEYGRLRHVEQAPDGSLWLLTSNRDGRGSPIAADDRIIRIS